MMTLKTQIKEYTRVYGGYVAKEINEKQNALASQLKKTYFKWWEKHGSPLTSEQLLYVANCSTNCLLLSEDPGLKQDKLEKHKAWNKKMKKYCNQIDFYVNEIVSKCGGRDDWGVNARCNSTLSTFKSKDGKTLLMPPGREALTIVMWINYEDKWKWEWEQIQAGVAKDQYQKKKKFKETKYTNSSSGQCIFGGWNEAGRLMFLDLRDQNAKAQKQKHVATLERQHK